VIGGVVDSGRVRDLPLNGRNFLQLWLLTGGAADISPANDNFAASIGHPARAIILPGTLPYSVSYFLNGIPIRGSRDGELALNLSIAAVDQFKIQESFLMPDQGPNAAAVNVVTKSGSNQFHGEVFEFLRNGSLDARSLHPAGDVTRAQPPSTSSSSQSPAEYGKSLLGAGDALEETFHALRIWQREAGL
jgi:hypothetical protein